MGLIKFPIRDNIYMHNCFFNLDEIDSIQHKKVAHSEA